MTIKVHDIKPHFISEARNNERPIWPYLYHSDPNIKVEDPEKFLAAYSQEQSPKINDQTNIVQAFYGGNSDEKNNKNDRDERRNNPDFLTSRGDPVAHLRLPDLGKGAGSNTGSNAGSNDEAGITTGNDSSNDEIKGADPKTHYKLHDINEGNSGLLSEKTDIGVHGGLAYFNVTNGGKSRRKKRKRKRIKRTKRKSRKLNKSRRRKRRNSKSRKLKK